MLQKLNERIKGLLAWIIILIVSFTFVLFGVDYYLQSRQSGSTLAEVNGEAISTVQFEAVYRRIQQQAASQGRLEDEASLKKQVLEDLILNTVLTQAARQAGLLIDLNQVNAMILQIPQFQEGGRFSATRYQQALVGAMYTATSFSDEVKEGMLLNQQRFGFMGGAFVLPEELARYVASLYERRDYAYLDIPLTLVKDKIQVTEGEAQHYYQQHLLAFMTPFKVKIAYVLLSADALKPQIHISEADLRHYYEDNQANFTQPARWKVAHILFAFPEKPTESSRKLTQDKANHAYAHLRAHPEQFSEWAKTKSDDLLAAKQAGVLPWIVAGQSHLEPALLPLTKPGQLAKPFLTDKGYELIQLIAIDPAKVSPLEQVKAQISEQLLMEKVQAQYAKQLESLAELSYQSPDTLEPVSAALKLPILHSQPFSKSSSDEAMTQLPQVIQAAFSQDVLSLGNNSEVIQLDDTHVLVLRVEKQFLAKQEAFAVVKEKIMTQLTFEKSQAMLAVWGTSLINGQPSMMLTSLPWHEEKAIVREAQTASPAIQALAFKIEKVHHMAGLFLPNGHYVVVRLDSKTPGRLDDIDHEQKQALIQQLVSSDGRLDYDLYVQGLVEQAKITRS